jgi:hypothetical protein
MNESEGLRSMEVSVSQANIGVALVGHPQNLQKEKFASS